MQEGCGYRFQISFRVNHELVEGLRFLNATRGTLAAQKEELVIGSYAPCSAPHVFTFPRRGFNECPKGMLFRGKYTCTDAFVDSNGFKHLEYSYALTITK